MCVEMFPLILDDCVGSGESQLNGYGLRREENPSIRCRDGLFLPIFLTFLGGRLVAASPKRRCSRATKTTSSLPSDAIVLPGAVLPDFPVERHHSTESLKLDLPYIK